MYRYPLRRETEELFRRLRHGRGMMVNNEPVLGVFYVRGPRIIATDRQAPRIYPRMIRLCSRFDSVLFTPKISEIPSYGNYSRSP